jgi:hypothetical protein
MTDYAALINAASQQANVDPRLTRAVLQTESNLNPNAYNATSGAAGMGQLIPATAQALGVSNPYDPNQAIPATARLLSEDLRRYGNPAQAVAAYHGGTNPANWGPKTQAYVQKVGQAFQGQTMDTTDPLDQMLAAKAGRATNGQTLPPSTASASDPLDNLLAQRASGASGAAMASAGIKPSPWMTGDLQAQQQAIEGQMTPQERAKSQALWSDVTGAGNTLGELAKHGWLGRTASSLGQGALDTANSLTQLAGLVGNRVGLISDEDVGTMMRAAERENQIYEQARQAALSPTLSSLVSGQKPQPGIDWGRMGGQLLTAGGLQSGLERTAATLPLDSLKTAIPTLGADIGATRLGRLAQNALTGGGAAALAANQSPTDLGTQVGAGAVAGMVLPPVVSKLASTVAGPAARALLGKMAATPDVAAKTSQAVEQAAAPIMNAVKTDAQGNVSIDASALPKTIQDMLNTGALKNLTPEQQARALTYEALGIKNYTLADVTRQYADAATERNLAQNVKAGGPLREADAAKNEQLLNAANNASGQMGAAPTDAYEIGSAIRQHLQGQLGQFNQRIQNLYQQADAAAKNAPQVKIDPVIQALQANRSQFLARNDGISLLNGIRARLQEFAGGAPTTPSKPLMVDASGNPVLTQADVPQGMTFSDSERFRQFLNDVATPDNYPLVNKLKAAIDQAQDASGSGDIYKEARALRQQRSAMFENQTGIANILAQKPGGDPSLPVDALLNRYVFNKGNADQLSQLVNQLNMGGEEGQAILNRLRSTVVQNAVSNAISRVPGEKGAGALSGTGLAQQLDKIGQKKMNVLFTPEQQNYLGALRRGALDLTTSPPVRNPYNPSGTSAQGINMLDLLSSQPKPPGWLGKAATWGVGKIPVVGHAIQELGAQARDRMTQAAEASQASMAAKPFETLSRLSQKDQQAALRKLIAQRLMGNPALLGGAIQPSGGQ